MSIDVKQAVAAAEKFLTEVYEGRDKDVRLEETEQGSSYTPAWLITLSFTLPSVDSRSSNPLAEALGVTSGGRTRHFKTFTVDRETGEVQSMKIRQVN